MPEINGKPAEYIGDGVYVIFDGYFIWLHANDPFQPTGRIALEPQVLQALRRFAKAMEVKMCKKNQIAKKERTLIRFEFSFIVDPLDNFSKEDAETMLTEFEEIAGKRGIELDDSSWLEESL